MLAVRQRAQAGGAETDHLTSSRRQLSAEDRGAGPQGRGDQYGWRPPHRRHCFDDRVELLAGAHRRPRGSHRFRRLRERQLVLSAAHPLDSGARPTAASRPRGRASAGVDRTRERNDASGGRQDDARIPEANKRPHMRCRRARCGRGVSVSKPSGCAPAPADKRASQPAATARPLTTARGRLIALSSMRSSTPRWAVVGRLALARSSRLSTIADGGGVSGAARA